MKRMIKLFITVLCIAFAFSGCSDSLSEMSVAQGVGIDSFSDSVKVSVQYLDLTKGNGTSDNLGQNITSVACGTADNISSAVSNASVNLSSPVFFGQNKVIVFGSDYLKNGVDGVVDYALRAVDSRPDVLVALSKTTAEQVIKSSENKARVPAQDIYDMLKQGEKAGLSYALTVKDLQNYYLLDTSDVFLPVLSTKNNKTTLDGMAVFSNGKYVKTLGKGQTLGFLLVNGRVKNANVILDDKKYGKVGVELTDIKVKNSAYYNNAICFDSNICFDINLNDTERGIINKLDNADVKRIEILAKNKVSRLCCDAVYTCLQNGCDTFFVGRLLSKSNNAQYDLLRDNWRNELSQAKATVTAYPKLNLINGNYKRN